VRLPGRSARKLSRPKRRWFFEAVIVSKVTRNWGAGMWERNRVRKNTGNVITGQEKLKLLHSFHQFHPTFVPRCLGVTKLLFHWGWM